MLIGLRDLIERRMARVAFAGFANVRSFSTPTNRCQELDFQYCKAQ